MAKLALKRAREVSKRCTKEIESNAADRLYEMVNWFREKFPKRSLDILIENGANCKVVIDGKYFAAWNHLHETPYETSLYSDADWTLHFTDITWHFPMYEAIAEAMEILNLAYDASDYWHGIVITHDGELMIKVANSVFTDYRRTPSNRSTIK